MQDKKLHRHHQYCHPEDLAEYRHGLCFYDSGDGVALRSAADMKSDYIIGEKSLMTNYSYNTSIDSQTYNSIKLVRPEQGRPASPMFLSERIRTPLPAGACCSSIKRWTKRPQTHRSRSRQRSVWSITLAFCSNSNSPRCVNSLRAGQLLLVNINDLDGDPFRKYVMLEKVSHTWENDLHTMELEAKALWGGKSFWTSWKHFCS